MKKIYNNTAVLAFMLLCLMVFSVNVTKAQIISGNAFLQGSYVEVGVAPCGRFGTTVGAPAAYHPRPGSIAGGTGVVPGSLGFVADFQADGWNVGNPSFAGDYFIPANPEEGFSVRFNGSVFRNGIGFSSLCGGSQIPGGVTGYSNANGVAEVTWNGSAGQGGALGISSRTYVPLNALYFVTEVTLTNNTAGPMNGVYYMRTVNPDNTQALNGSFTTNNSVVFQNPNVNNTALVQAVGIGIPIYLGLGSKDCRARVSHGGAFNVFDPQLVWNGQPFGSGTRTNVNENISIAFNIGTLAQGQSETVAFAYVLNANELNNALSATAISFFSNGSLIQPGSTTQTCSGQAFPLSIVNTTGYSNWTWSPATGLNTTTGTSVTATITSPITYTATGNGICGTRSISVTLNPVSAQALGDAVSITGPQVVCAPANVTYSTPAIANATSYVWTLPPGSSIISGAGTNNITVSYTGSTSSGNVSVAGANACGNGTAFSMPVIISCSPLTTAPVPTSICAGASVDVDYVTGGSLNAGNIFTAQLSNASGSFASPVVIGTLSATSSGTISCVIPANTPAGAGYRIRVVSSNPALTGIDNGANISINTSPVISCPSNITTGNDPGQCGAAVSFNASASGFPVPAITYSQNPGTFFSVGAATNVIATATNVCGSSVCNFDVTVNDNTPPTASCQPLTIQLDANGNATINASQLDNGSSDNCGSITTSVSQTNFNCSNLGVNTITFTVTDQYLNSSSCNAVVTVTDVIPPSITCPANITNVIATSTAGAVVNYATPVGTDNCSSVTTRTAGPASGSVFPIGTTTVTHVVTDAAGLTATCSFTVTVVGVAPQIVCPANISVNNTPGSCGANVSYTATETTGIPASTITYSIAPGNFFNVGGSVIVTATATNAVGTSSCNFTVSVSDNQPPTAVCQNVTVNLDANGQGSITAAQVNNGSSDNCGIASLNVSPSTFNCFNLSSGTASASGLFFSEYVEGSSNNKYIEIYNGTGAAVNLSNYQLRLYANGAATPTTTNTLSGSLANGATIVYRNSSATIFAGTSTVLSAVNWNGDDAIALFNTVTGQNEDIFGVIGNDPGTAWTLGGNTTIDKTLRRKATVISGVTVNPSGTGVGAFTTLATEWDQFAIDNVVDLGAHTFTPPPMSTPVTLTVTDVNGNSSTCIAQVTILDITPPSITTCAPNQDVNLNGTCQLVVPNLVAQTTATDNCSVVVTQTPAAGTILASGHNQTHVVTITATDASGNAASCTVTLTGKDVTPPTAVCQNVTVSLDANGQGSITPAQVNNGSSDNCGTVNLVSVVPNTFTCSNLSLAAPAGDLFISEYIEGTSNNKCIEIFNGTGAPVDLGAGGYQLLVYFNGSTTAGLTFNLSGTVAAGDVHVVCQSSSAPQFLAVADQTSTSAWHNGDDAIVLRKGGSIILDIIGRIGEDPGSEWGTGLTSTADNTIIRNANIAAGVTTNPSSGFPTLASEWTGFATDYSSGLGAHTFTPPPAPTAVTLTINDGNGNTSTCIAQVTVIDNITPSITTCAPNQDVSLNGTCQLVVPNLISQTTATDNCSVTVTQSPVAGTVLASGHNQTHTVVITATDASGNSTSCSVTLTGKDVTPPTAVCQNVTVLLDNNGQGSITAAQVNNGSSDNCGTVNLVSVSPNTFNCLNLSVPVPPSVWINEIHYDNAGADAGEFIELAGTAGINLADYALVRYNGSNPAGAVIYTSSAQLTTLTGSIPSQSNGYGTFAVYYAADGLQNGTADGVALVNTATNTVVQLLSYEGVFTVAAGQGAAAGMTSTDIGVSESGTVTGGSVRLTGLGNQYGNFTWQPESAPASPGAINPGQSFPASANTVTLTVNDGNGNTSTCTASVTVLDQIAPVAVCQNISVNLDASGNASITAMQIDNGSSDNCGIVSMTVSPSSFTCANVGANTVTLTVTDASGNSHSCTATVTVVDNTAPTAVCQNLTVYLDANGAASITASQIDNGSSDNCGIASISVSPSSFSCADLSTGQAVANGLFFSEYVEGSSFNKYVEIYNGTGAAVDLSTYQLRLYSNGSATVSTTSNLSGMLANGQTIVYRNSGAVAYGGSTTVASAVNWNGDDAIALYNTVTGQNVDIFGVIGNDPGTSWTAAGGYTTVDRTLRRKANVLSGITTNPSGTGPSAFATLASEWDVFSIDDVSGLGSHTFTPGPVGSTVTLTVTDVNGNSSTCNATVVVLDTISPSITCPSPINVNNDAGVCGAAVTYSVSYGDNCSGSTIQQTAGLGSGSVFPIGTTVNTYVVTDASGNTATCSFPVTVNDTEAPYFTNVPSSFSACNPVMWTPPTPNDNCPGAVSSSSHQPGDIFPSGTTTVTYTVTDAAGLQSSVTFDVTLLEPSVAADNMVSDRDYDNICVGEAITLTINGGSLGAGAQWVWYSGSCGGTPVASGVTSITVSPSATTTYYARAEGTCNNTACVQLTVVVSTGAPTVTPTYTYLPAYGAPGITDSLVVSPVSGATYYRWFTNNGQINGVLFNNQLSPVQTAVPRVDVTFVLSQQNYQLRVIAGNACGRSGQRNATVRGTVAAPSSLTGPTTVCPSETHSYTVSAIPSQSGNTQVSYNWQLIPANAGTISGSGLTRTITFAPGFNGAQLCVNGVSSFGLAGTPLCINIVTGAPAPAAILGAASVCEGASGVSYSATPVASAISYNWTSVPAGVIFSGNTDNVTATFPAGPWSGTICVAAVTSTCGTSQTTCISVSTITPGVLSGITGPVSGVCLESNVNYTTDAGATSYSWTLPSGATGSSTSSSINVNFGAGFTSGTIEVTGNFACNTSTTSISVTGAPATPSVATGGLSSICPGAAGVQYSVVSTGATEFTWTASGVATTSGCANPPLCSSYNVDEWGMTPSLSVTAQNSCGVSSAYVFPVGCRMMENDMMNTSVYPNPTNGRINIEFTSSAKADHTIRITDLAGRVVVVKEVNAAAGTNVVSLDLTEQGAGMYLVHITDHNGAAAVTRIAVE